MNEPQVSVGIMSSSSIGFILDGAYSLGNDCFTGEQEAVYQDGKIVWQGRLWNELSFFPKNPASDSFYLKDVTIGVNFHWERKETQRFRGTLKLIVQDERIIAVNCLPVEDYLLSVISSEMSATASLELLKAHAVISRSWLLAQIQKNKELLRDDKKAVSVIETETEFIRWYDREDHTLFDVCADDHCQRYQGITRASTTVVAEAIEATRGQVVSYAGKICDARFSKCCGGVVEEFQTCWEDIKHPYLVKLRDGKDETDFPDLRNENNAREWICTSPDAFCNTTDKNILSQVLNNYDQETTDFYRWTVSYSQEELSALILKRSGIDFGQILDMVPVERGTSGRLVKLKIIGTKKTLIVGKELEIRRILSASHLYSSAFVVEKEDVHSGVPGRFVLRGAGWGHGVGLCQIGAAVMGEQGYKYEDILLHYFVDAVIEKLY